MITSEGFLAYLFKQADKAGFGYAKGASFEAIPGLEDAAADYIEALMKRFLGDDQEHVGGDV